MIKEGITWTGHGHADCGFETGKSWKAAGCKVVQETQGPTQKYNPPHSYNPFPR